MRIENLIVTAMITGALGAGGAFAQSTDVTGGAQIVIESPKIANLQSVQGVIEDLTAAGFTYIEIRRTFLGRARVIAYSAMEMREVILNRTTGEVLRDLAQAHSGNLPDRANSHASAGNGNKGGNSNNSNAGGGNDN